MVNFAKILEVGMKVRLIIAWGFLLFTCHNTFAQKKVLFTINDSPTYVDEFIYTFSKNNRSDNLVKQDIDDYLNLYLNFKLKVTEARHLGMDTLKEYIKELNTYQLQLMDPYLTEKGITDSLVMEAYDRMNWEVDVSHILVNQPLNSSAEDSMVGYKKITEVRDLALKGVDFSELAVKYSEEPGVQKTKGRLGYFTSFQMVYPFETAAYNTPVDSISNIIRTRFGFHILKVHDRRPAHGKVQVSHLMLRFDKDMGHDDSIKIQNKIFELHDLAKGKYNWNELVQTYSEDRNSSKNRGLLSQFGVGEMITEIAETAFSLDSVGSVSDPVMSPYGWHILRLENIQPIKTFDELKPSIERRVARDTRSNKSEKVLILRLKDENGFYENTLVVDALLDSINTIYNGFDWQYSLSNPQPTDTLFLLSDSVYTIEKLNYFVKHSLTEKSPKQTMKVLYDDFMKISLLDYEKAHLELKYPEYKHLLNEYREGILLFNVMEDVVWSATSNDSIGLKAYYQKNFNQYQTQESVTISIFEYPNEIDSTKFNRIIQTIFNDSTSLPGIAEKEIRKNFPEMTIVKSGTFQKDDNLENDVFRPKGIYKLTGDEGINMVLVVWEYDPVYDPEFENIRGSVISDYQEFIENNWLNNLRGKYPVVINKKELKKIYRRFVR